MSGCTHEVQRSEWVPDEEEFYGVAQGHWNYWSEYTTVDIDTGRYKCTQCGKVMYYTGLWKEHWEGGRKLLDEKTGNIK